MIKFLFFIIKTFCLISLVDENKPAQFIHNLVEGTVVLAEVEVMYRKSSTETWLSWQEENVKIIFEIFTSPDENWENITSNGKFLAEYSRLATKTSFFLTASEAKYYLYEMKLELPKDISINKDYQFGLKTAIYEGTQRDPRIISLVDTVMIELAKHIEKANESMKHIKDVQKLDSLNDITYKSLISSIRHIVVMTFCFKIFVFFCTYYFLNKNLLNFFQTKKIVS